jgi:hypothetical protein
VGGFSKISEVAQIFGLHFDCKSRALILTKMVWAIFWAIKKTYLVTLAPLQNLSP